MKITDIKPAPYNPRKISDRQLQMLAKAMSEFGDLSGIVFNRLTGNLVGGHQRLKGIPKNSVIKKKDLKEKTKTGTVAEGTIFVDGENWNYREVEWDITKEKLANLAANKHGGDWDEDKLKEIMAELRNEGGTDIDLSGFNSMEIDEMLADCPSIGDNEKIHLNEELEDKSKTLREYKKTHILISFDPNIYSEIKNHISEISKIEGVEIEQSSN